MESKVIKTDGESIVIRPMGLDYIMADEEPPGLKVDVECRTGAKVWPNPLYVAYHKALIEAYGSCGILAWDEHNTVVGFLPFRPKNCGLYALPDCIHYVGKVEEDDDPDFAPPTLEMFDSSEAIPFEQLSAKTLTVHCLSVKPSLRRKGLGSQMVLFLIDWARTRGWGRIEGGFAFVEGGGYGWLPDIAFWEGTGFTRIPPTKYDGRDPIHNKPGLGFAMDL